MVVLVIRGSVRWWLKSPNSTAVLHLDGHLALYRQRGENFHHLHGRYLLQGYLYSRPVPLSELREVFPGTQAAAEERQWPATEMVA